VKNNYFIGLFAVLSFGMFLSACDRVSSGHSSVVIQMPTVEQMQTMSKSDVSSMSAVDLQKLCFAVNVKGPGIASVPAATCDVERGIIAGAVGPGGELAVDVEIGMERSFELYAFLKQGTEPCPKVAKAGWSWPLERIYFLGKADNVEVKPNTVVEIPFTVPSQSQNIAVQKSWPASCLVTTKTAPKRIGRIVSGAGVMVSPMNYKVYSKVGPFNDEKTLGTNYKIKNWKVSQ
jgi:hypothetical protein